MPALASAFWIANTVLIRESTPPNSPNIVPRRSPRGNCQSPAKTGHDPYIDMKRRPLDRNARSLEPDTQLSENIVK
jgi:hypothetical protein